MMNVRGFSTLALGLIGVIMVCAWTSSHASLLGNENISTRVADEQKIDDMTPITFTHVSY